MSNREARHSDKPYDIRERLAIFAERVVRAAQKAHAKSPIAAALCANLVRAAVSAASNAEEADDASSTRDFLAKERIALRETKETRLRLRVLHGGGYLHAADVELVQEAIELTRILATIIRNREHGSRGGERET